MFSTACLKVVMEENTPKQVPLYNPLYGYNRGYLHPASKVVIEENNPRLLV